MLLFSPSNHRMFPHLQNPRKIISNCQCFQMAFYREVSQAFYQYVPTALTRNKEWRSAMCILGLQEHPLVTYYYMCTYIFINNHAHFDSSSFFFSPRRLLQRITFFLENFPICGLNWFMIIFYHRSSYPFSFPTYC